MEPVHHARELGKPGVETRDVENQEPGQEETGVDIWLENEPQVVQNVLPAMAGVPPAMLREALNEVSSRRVLGPLRLGWQGWAWKADQGRGAKHQRPPALNRGVVRHRRVRPSSLVFRQCEALRDPRAQAIRLAKRLFDLPLQVGHEIPGPLFRPRGWIGREKREAETLTLPREDLTDEAGWLLAIGEAVLKGAPPGQTHPLAWGQPPAVIGAESQHVFPVQFLSRVEKLRAFPGETVGEHDLKRKASRWPFLDQLNGQLRWGLVGIARHEPGVRFVPLEKQREGHLVQHPVGIHRDDPVVLCAQISTVLMGHIVGGLALVLVACLIDAQRERPARECVLEQREPGVPQLLHVPGRGGDQMVQRLRSTVSHRMRDRRQRLTLDFGQHPDLDLLSVFTTVYIRTYLLVPLAILINEGHRRGGRWCLRHDCAPLSSALQ